MSDIRTYGFADALARAAADLVAATALSAATGGRTATIALSGGSTPLRMFRLLAAEPLRDEVRWDAVSFYWVDERDVAPDSPECNAFAAHDSLLRHVPVPEERVHVMSPWDGGPEAAAARYEDVLRETVATGANGLPRFDLVLLGMGADGHTASLFPYTAGLQVRDRLCIANPYRGPAPANTRVTLTFPVLNAADRVAFLVSGSGKAGTLRKVLNGPRNVEALPAQGVEPADGELIWLVDADAATLL